MNLIEMALADFSGAETFPLDALLTLRQKWDEAREALLDRLAAYVSGADRSEENADILFFTVHLMAEKRERTAFAGLAALALEGKPLEDMIGDAASETLPQLFISLYDGDLALLKQMIETPEANEWARVAALECFSWLAATGVIEIAAADEYLRGLFGSLQPQSTDLVWYGWQTAVAQLGLVDLEPLAARAFRIGLIDKDMLDFEQFQTDLRTARAQKDRSVTMADWGLAPIDDAVEALSVFDPENQEEEEPAGPAANPNRDVGRNDPCPCGSGKKFKKCCLGVET